MSTPFPTTDHEQTKRRVVRSTPTAINPERVSRQLDGMHFRPHREGKPRRRHQAVVREALREGRIEVESCLPPGLVPGRALVYTARRTQRHPRAAQHAKAASSSSTARGPTGVSGIVTEFPPVSQIHGVKASSKAIEVLPASSDLTQRPS
eukprot:2215992-Amphidinium_carterae.1